MAETNFTPSQIVSAATETAQFIQSRLSPELAQPSLGIICGSGLGGLADTVAPSPQVAIPYEDIPNFAHSTVKGHEGKLVFGLLGETGTPVVLMVGRVQFVYPPLLLLPSKERRC